MVYKFLGQVITGVVLNRFDDTYRKLLALILDSGQIKRDRTGVGIKSVFGHQMRFNLRDGFPLLTTKKVNFDAIVYELIWFLSGDTNIRFLLKHRVNIWNEWPYQRYQRYCPQQPLSMTEFKTKILGDDRFARQWGELGPVYGRQWRNFNGVDQIKRLIRQLKTKPYSRRHVVCSWNVAQLDQMLLPPCHALFQFYVNAQNELSCQLYQRSGDVFLGVPFNIASYSLLTVMIAHVCRLKVGEFIHTLGDAHLYLNHVQQAQTQLNRTAFPPPQLRLAPHVESVFAFKRHDIKLINYQHHARIAAPIAV